MDSFEAGFGTAFRPTRHKPNIVDILLGEAKKRPVQSFSRVSVAGARPRVESNNTLVWRGENQTRTPRSGVARFSQVASLSSRRCWLAARLEIARSTSLGGYEGQKGWSIVFDYGDDHLL